MNILTRLLVAAESKLPFKEAYKRITCMDKNHFGKDYTVIDCLQSEKHPQSDKDFVYTIYIVECKNCSIIYPQTAGLDHRN